METVYHSCANLITAAYTYLVLAPSKSRGLPEVLRWERAISGWAGIASILAYPWLVLLIIGLCAKRWLGIRHCVVVISCAGLPMLALYLIQIFNAWTDHARGGWTAATLELGLIPVLAIPLLMIAAVYLAVMLLLNKHRSAATST